MTDDDERVPKAEKHTQKQWMCWIYEKEQKHDVCVYVRALILRLLLLYWRVKRVCKK